MAAATLEICVDEPDAIDGAVACGADRIELCSALALDGLTPSPGLLEIAASTCIPAGCDIAVMIRPVHRPDFVLTSPSERRALLADIQALHGRAPIEAFVFGALAAPHRIDSVLMQELIAAARPAKAVLHRAFDALDGEDPLEHVIELGFDRILTSGGFGAKDTSQGREGLATMVSRASSRIEIMAGGGVRASGITGLAHTGVRSFHASARSATDSEPSRFDRAVAQALRDAIDRLR